MTEYVTAIQRKKKIISYSKYQTNLKTGNKQRAEQTFTELVKDIIFIVKTTYPAYLALKMSNK